MRTDELIAYLADADVAADVADRLREQRAAEAAPVAVVTIEKTATP